MENNDSWISIAVIVLVFVVIGFRLMQRMKKHRRETNRKTKEDGYTPYEGKKETDQPDTDLQE